MVSAPHDQAARERFATELDRNFSVVAAAGSGKTRAITDRIVRMARAAGAEETLPRLVVLTFANRAADEMQQRARQEMQAAGVSAAVLAAFERAWFGTIHAFCLRLLNDYGHFLGLPSPLELVTDDEDLWNEFVQNQTRIGRSLAPEHRVALLRLAPIRQIMELARCAGSALLRVAAPGDCPDIQLDGLRTELARAKQTETVANSRAQLAAWEDAYHTGADFLRWPICFTKAKGIDETWARAFAPLRRWVNDSALCVAAEVQRDYRNFRLERGVVTYADQIALADELLQHPEAAARLRQLDHIVLLDEAQDTDPAQFSVLLEITRPPGARDRWLDTRVQPPRPGRFSMVGDFQQSIYHDRADLAYYRRVHQALIETDAGEALTFSVTFRLDQKQLDFVNATFAEILHGAGGQVEFVGLQPRPQVLPGQVVRLPLTKALLNGRDDLKEHQKARIEADELAKWLAQQGVAKLRARSWREVAILCPRRDWLRTMAGALRRARLPVEVQSESELQADSPAYAWVTALCVIMAEPQNHYEIVGVLREVFGVSDHDLAVFAEANGERFQIEERSAAGIVSSRLADLAELRAIAITLPLFAAVEFIIERTALRARLASLRDEDFKDPMLDLETLLTFAAEAGARGATLPEFATRLRSEIERQRPVRLSDRDAIQLITAHKAKGLEWDAVIVPFLSRRITDFPNRYPSIVRVPGSDEVIAALYKEDREAEIKAALKLLQRQETERLLYVALTRARHTLVLALDRDLFQSKKEAVHENSQLRLLQADIKERNASALAAMAEEMDACARTAASWQKRNGLVQPSPTPLVSLSRSAIEEARARAAVFIHKQNPSDREEPADLPVGEMATGAPRIFDRGLFDNPATLYGGWWHSLFEHFPWKASAADWRRAFSAFQPLSPDPQRSAREWELFLEHSAGESLLLQFLRRAGVVVFTEHPFMWRMDAQACIEGIIDLLVVDQAAGECLLVDWKTNRIAKGEESELRAFYQPQLAAYWRAVTEITDLNVQTAIYSTALGKLLPYEKDELRA